MDDTPMSDAASLESTEERMRRALRQFEALQGIRGGNISAPGFTWQCEQRVEKMRERQDEWLVAVPVLRDVQSWIDVQRDSEHQTQPLGATLVTRNVGGAVEFAV